uniref:Purine nucleoside phosphoramidase n=1 Tax=Candidatus Aschnera chinzeii TaxID=1485666 RepID=A0AAT9G4V4_9ENTR|nr:MAG: purine nucleoside phosphoramidase [Candidatus Aschnera chinzeii]
MIKDNIFSQIISHKINADIIYQDDMVTSFRDIKPLAPIHILIVPNICIPTINDIKIEHETTLGHMFTVAAKIAKYEKIDQTGYRLILNCNRHAGQEILYIHMHLLGGKFLGPLLVD